ncbi:MAG: cytochrome c [Bacteroidota bacterium]
MNIKIFGLILASSLIIACGGGQTSNKESAQKKAKPSPKKEVAKEEVAHPEGKKVYNQICLACHQANGKGLPGLYPPLTQTKWVSGDKETLIKTILNGMNGEIEVLGEKYNQVMTPYKDVLSDQQIADVLSYVRSSFGNDYSAITPAEVAAAR